MVSEFSQDDNIQFDAEFPIESETYRAFRFPWKGYPKYAPAIAAESAGQDDEVKIYASWNGATEVATWQVLAGEGPRKLKELASTPREGFETVITVKTTEPYVKRKGHGRLRQGARLLQGDQTTEERVERTHPVGALREAPLDYVQTGIVGREIVHKNMSG